MKTLIDLITEQVTNAFTGQGYDAKYGKVTLSNRPDLCEYQCNGAMAAAKEYKCAPFIISDKIAQALAEKELFESVESVKPGFINMKVSPAYLAKYVSDMKADEGRFGCDKAAHPKTIIVDYGGANVAKPLHVGHLRSAVIGESIKRIGKFMGHHMIGDVHLGDWGLQMGLIIVELKERKPDLVYYDESYTGEYPKEAPFTISELEDIYPTASKKSKEDEAFREAAMEATSQLQAGRRGYRALLAHILDVSVTDLKKNYDNLNVSFELWKGESDAQPYIPDMVQMMKDKGFAYMSEGALVVDVKEDTDTKEIPPCIILKSDGASLYSTTDLATIVMRMQDYNPDAIIYLTDQRQSMHFVQVFRCARKTGLVGPDVELTHIGFGTMAKTANRLRQEMAALCVWNICLMRSMRRCSKRLQRTRKKRKTSIFPRKRQSRLQKRLLWQQSNTEICPIRQARTTVLILSVLLLLKGIQDRIFYIRLCVLNPF